MLDWSKETTCFDIHLQMLYSKSHLQENLITSSAQAGDSASSEISGRFPFQAIAWMWLAFIVFVIYGSLIPLDYRPMPLASAWEAFKHIRFLELGIESRADWVANGVLYGPVGFLTACLLAPPHAGLDRRFGLLIALVFSAALAFSVEFIQVFFPARTVSANDLLAEFIGSTVGVIVSARYGRWFGNVVNSFLYPSRHLVIKLLEAYTLVYLLGSLFPYDFLVSRDELLAKAQSGSWGLFLAGNSSRPFIVIAQLVLEGMLAAPAGIVATQRLGTQSNGPIRIACFGFLFGTAIEIGQFFTATGISQGLSVLSRMFGVCLGMVVYRNISYWPVARISKALRDSVFLLGPIYLTTLVGANSLLQMEWRGTDALVAQWQRLHFMPFYYHYFTTEAKAVQSLIAVCLSYLPIGIYSWAMGHSRRSAFLTAFVIAGLIEACKLFMREAHPDPTNVILAGLTAWIAIQFIQRLEQSLSSHRLQLEQRQTQLIRSSETSAVTRRWWLIVPLLAVAFWLITFPVAPILLFLVISVCAIFVWQQPSRLFFIVPAAFPIFDFASWSGRFFWDEFDALLTVCVTIAIIRVTPRTSKERLDLLWTIASSTLGLSFAVSTLLALLSIQTPDSNAFTSYFSPYNAMRILKGAVWAYILSQLAQKMTRPGIDVRLNFGRGMVLGLAFTAATVIWERIAFTEILDFSDNYRVTGPFSAMHVGGAYIECFLVAASAFLIHRLIDRRSVIQLIGGVMLLLASTYALMVTFSRGGYVGFLAVVVVFLVINVVQPRRSGIRLALISGLVVGLLLVVVPIYSGNFARSRIATLQSDLKVRIDHWSRVLNLRDQRPWTHVVGMGLGTFPVTHYWNGTDLARPGTHVLLQESDNTYLRLGTGDPVYVDQVVSVHPQQTYILKFDARSSKHSTLVIPICEKWMLTSRSCMTAKVSLDGNSTDWHHFAIELKASELAAKSWYEERTVKLSLFYSEPGSTVDVDNIELLGQKNENLIKNGDFSKGMDHWFFSTDSHLQWHAKSLFIGALFDQGWLGVLGLAAVLIIALTRSVLAAVRGDLHSAAMFSALLGFSVIGIFDTLSDSPRFLMLLLLLTWMCARMNSPLPQKQPPS